MALKTTKAKGMPRTTYRSSVKQRPLDQNGLEAQYQGLDIREVNIDHAGLAILGRGGSATGTGFRDIVKTKRQYKVVKPGSVTYPEMTFSLTPNFAGGANLKTLFADTNTQVRISGADGTVKRYQFSTESQGTLLTSGHTAVTVTDERDPLKHLAQLKKQIQADYGENTFEITVFNHREGLGSSQESRMKIVSKTSSALGQLDFTCNLATIIDSFEDENESHRWALHGYTVQTPIRHAFYEDLRADTIAGSTFGINGKHSVSGYNSPHDSQSFGRGEQFSKGQVFQAGESIVNLEGHLSGTIGTLPSNVDPVNLSIGDTLESDEIRIEQLPKRQVIFNTFEDTVQWREDTHYLHPDEQLWSIMSDKADLYVVNVSPEYANEFEQHIANMLDSNFADEQYIDKSPLSGRADCLNRLSKHYDTHVQVMTERHQFSILDQYLESSIDFVNISRNTIPVADVSEGQIAFEDNVGKPLLYKRITSNDVTTDVQKFLEDDYFDQRYVDAHDYVEAKLYTRIDDDMLAVVTGTHSQHPDPTGNIQKEYRRDWQEPNYIHTSTGFVTSQVTGHEGIMFRDLMR